MFLVLWEFEVKPSCEQQFVKVYGPGGDWDLLFRRDANHTGTYLYRDTGRPHFYLTADYWLTRESYEQFLRARENDYHTLDAATADLISSERRIGGYETL